jgi:hypothetical protein
MSRIRPEWPFSEATDRLGAVDGLVAGDSEEEDDEDEEDEDQEDEDQEDEDQEDEDQEDEKEGYSE